MMLRFVMVGFLLAGCAQVAALGRSGERASGAGVAVAVQSPGADTPRPEPRPVRGTAQSLGRAGMTADALDQTSAAERAAALAPPATRTQLLGETLASLGGVGEPGLWLRTGLVSRTMSGRIELAQGSGSLRVELRPSGAPAGAGSQLSLAAFRALDLSLTDLVALRVYAE